MDGHGLPSVSIVVPAYNESARIMDCIRSLLGQDYPRGLLQVIVVDNGSRDDTFAMLRATDGILALQERAPGSYAARNLALRHVSGEVVCFTDADCTASPGWVRNAVRHLAGGSVGIVAGHVELDLTPGQAPSASELFEKLFAFKQADNVREGRCVTANWCSRTALIRAMGGFDASLRSGGDRELAERIVKSGHRIVYAPDAIVHHPARTSRAELLRKRRRVAGGVYAMFYLGGRKSFAKLLWGFAKQALRRYPAVLKADGLTPLQRLRVLLVVSALGGASMLEALRLRCGGEPVR